MKLAATATKISVLLVLLLSAFNAQSTEVKLLQTHPSLFTLDNLGPNEIVLAQPITLQDSTNEANPNPLTDTELAMESSLDIHSLAPIELIDDNQSSADKAHLYNILGVPFVFSAGAAIKNASLARAAVVARGSGGLGVAYFAIVVTDITLREKFPAEWVELPTGKKIRAHVITEEEPHVYLSRGIRALWNRGKNKFMPRGE